MKILLDHNAPHGLRGELNDHEVHTADYLGWSELRNGDLLEAASAHGYEILITCDQGMRHEQNLSRYSVTLVTITSGDWNIIHQNIGLTRRAIETAIRGEANPARIPRQD